jgi:hypothetical protein
LLPGALFGLVQIDFGANSKQITTSYFGDPTDTQSFGASIPRVVFVTTVSAAVALNNPFVTTPTLVLGVCSVLLTAFAIVFLELAIPVGRPARPSSRMVTGTACGTSPWWLRWLFRWLPLPWKISDSTTWDGKKNIKTFNRTGNWASSGWGRDKA